MKVRDGDSSVGADHIRGDSRCVCVRVRVAAEESNYEHQIKLIYMGKCSQ